LPAIIVIVVVNDGHHFEGFNPTRYKSALNSWQMIN